jgi:hypothetical protein
LAAKAPASPSPAAAGTQCTCFTSVSAWCMDCHCISLSLSACWLIGVVSALAEAALIRLDNALAACRHSSKTC